MTTGYYPATSVCTSAGTCDMHRDGVDADTRCYGLCDAEGCGEEATVDVDDGCFCRADAARILAAS